MKKKLHIIINNLSDFHCTTILTTFFLSLSKHSEAKMKIINLCSSKSEFHNNISIIKKYSDDL